MINDTQTRGWVAQQNEIERRRSQAVDKYVFWFCVIAFCLVGWLPW